MKKKVLLIGQHGIIGNWPLLLSCYDGDECIFNIEEFSNAVSSIEASVNDAPKIGRATLDEPIYDLQGRRLSAKPQKGLYIQNGKKMWSQNGIKNLSS